MKYRNMITALCGMAIVLFAACGSNEDGKTVEPSMAQPVVVETPQADTVAEEAIPVAAPQPAPAPKPAVKKTAKAKPKTETHFVSSFDAKGDVWGHVTMTGDHGTGVIHDSEENTFTVTCTRHGNELFAVDQNSRRYVFKLSE
ncbi:MAG: hypothetical protein IJ620_06875 [Bacteroidales bacterium]|nr:hypothetical protein [Bacteroidales bacterium]